MVSTRYPNQFARIGVTREEALARVQAAFDAIFTDPEQRFYHEVDEDTACLEDTGNHDARTEGISYGMMMAVQMNRKDLFDRLWLFARRYMYLDRGPMAGYFAWSVQLDGTHNAEGPAPDGEEYFAMALLMASARWGEGEGVLAYASEGRAILRHMVHQRRITGGGEMMHPDNHYILFVPGCPFSDPSYHLPHFYELFARMADEEDRPFWREAAVASRRYIALSAHPETGMNAEYAEFDGTPRLLFDKPYAYYSDAYRVAMNIALDTLWFGRHDALSAVVTHLQDFFHDVPADAYLAYDLDGTKHDEPAMHPVAITSVLGAASIASDSVWADDLLRRLWQTMPRTGERRYYDNCLYFFCVLMLAGCYIPYGLNDAEAGA